MAEALQSIELISPSGKSYVAKWVGNAISMKKKVAVFEYPDVNGASTQDLGVASQEYPLDLYFDGPFHVENVQAFHEAIGEKGIWTVYHPVYGIVELQPLTLKIEVQPVINRTVTVVSTTWVRVIPSYEGKTFEQLESTVKESVEKILDSATFDEKTTIEKVRDFFRKVVDTIKKGVRTFYEINNKTRQFIANKLAAIDAAINGVGTLIKTVVSAINSVLQVIARVKGYVKTKIAMFRKMGDSIRTSINESLGNGTMSVEIANSNDGVMAGIMAAEATATTTGTVLSREEAIEIGNAVLAEWKETTTLSDEVQAELTARLSREEYFGNLNNYDDIKNMIGVTLGYVLDNNYADQIRKVVVLEKSRSTLDVAVSEYPDRDVDDAYNFLIDTNLLTGDDIVTLGAGRRVVVYV